MESINIEETKLQIIFINDINYLLDIFFKDINKDDIKLYFMNKNPENYNNYVIKNISNEQKYFLKENIIFSMNCLKKLNSSLINKNIELNYDSWKMCIFDNMFFNLPFTLQDVIFIPMSYIISSMQKPNILNYILNGNNIIDNDFSKTLIHEKIHLLQRYNQNIWDNYILKNTKWLITNKTIINNCSFINNNKIIYNPDTFYVHNKFIYQLNNMSYYGMMIVNSHNIVKNVWFQAVKLENIINLYPINELINKYEHPYEELAYTLANILVVN
jgi:hypothetical protein